MKRILLYILPMLLFFSCAKDDLTGSGAVQDAEGVKNTFSLNVDNSALVQTRSSADNQVDTAKIENVWVVQFTYSSDGSGALMGAPQYLDKTTDFNPSNMEVKLKAGTCNIYFVANTFDASAFNSSNCTTETTFKALSKSFTSDTLMQNQLVNTNQRVPMIGKLPQYTVTATAAPTGDSNKKVMLTRTAALIDFNYQVAFPAGQHFDIKSIRVCNVPNKMYYVQNTSLTNSNANDYYDYPLEGISQNVTANTSQSGHVMFYLPDNLCGNSNDGNTDTRKKNGITGKQCTYIEIAGVTSDNKFVAYKVYLGKNNLTNYDVERNNFYKVNLTLQGISEFDYNMSSGLIVDKSNCYMVMPGQTILIPARDQVNYYYTNYPASGTQLPWGTRWKTEMLWTESANGMKANGCIESLKADVSNGYIWVKAGTEQGNSLICVKDLSGKVLWSWHIWVTDYQPSVSLGGDTYSFNGKTWMDRNLGATSALVSGKNIGLMYEFGRKDPFPGGNGTSDIAVRKIFDASGVELTDGGNGIKYVGGPVGVSVSVANPTVYYYNPNDYNRWTVDSGWDTLWGNSYNAAAATKKIYDPCPSGWRIPQFNNSVSPWNGLTTANGVRSSSSGIGAWNWQLLGVGFFPAGGYRSAGNNGALSKVGTEVGCWSGSSSYLDTENSTPGQWPWSDPIITHTYSMGGVMLSGLDDGTVNTGRLYIGTANGFAVRCIKE